MIWDYSVPSLLCLSLHFPPTHSFSLKLYCSFLLKNIHIYRLYYGMEILVPEKLFFLSHPVIDFHTRGFKMTLALSAFY